MRIVKGFTALMIVLVSSFASFSQQVIEGEVIDMETKEALVGANVVVANTTQGTVTNINGKFKFETTENVDSITISFIGYQPQTLKWTSKSVISLESSSSQLNQFVVTASREKQERKDVPVSISTVSPQVINEAKATSIDQVLNKVHGVYMVDLGNEQHSMSIRQPLSYSGMFLYLEDGIPIRPTGIFNHNAMIEMNMASTRSMEIIRGPASSLYGSDAIGGAVNFLTHKPTAIPTGTVQIQGNDIGYKRVDVMAANTWKKFGLVASGYYASRRNGPRDHSDMDKLAFTLRGDLHISDNTTWTNAISYVDYKTDMTGGLDSANFFTENYSSTHTFTYRNVKALRVRSTLNHKWNEKSKTNVTAFFRDNAIGQNPQYRVKDDYKPWNGTGNPNLAYGEENLSSFQSYGFIAQHEQKFTFLDAKWISGVSLDYSPSDYYSEFILIDKSDDGIYTGYHGTDSLLADYSADLLNTAAYTQLEITPIEHLKIVGAVRYDRISYNYDNNLDSNAFSGVPDGQNNFSQFTPKVGATYDFGRGIGAYVNYAIGFSPPEVSELYRGVKVPTLEPSTYTNYEVGGWLAFAKRKGYLEVTFYQLDGMNEIISVKQDDGSTEKENAGKTKHTGVEYSIKYAPTKEWMVRFGGVNAEHKFVDFVESGKDYTGNEMATAPRFIANAEVTYKPKFLKGARIGVEWQHLGEYYMDQANTEKYPGFNVLNLRVGYKIKGFEFWLNTLNILDERYATIATKSSWGKSYRPGDPRNFNLGVSYRITGK